MRKTAVLGMILMMALAIFGFAAADGVEGDSVLTAEEIEAFAARIQTLAQEGTMLNDPASEDALSEDGYAFQYDFGVVYADQNAWTENTRMTALVLMDRDIPGPRDITVDWTVNGIMNSIPCSNPEMYGTYEEAVLYLVGDAENGFLYGRVWRDGQRISAMEYGAAIPAEERKLSVTFGISGDGVNYVRAEGLTDSFSRQDAVELYGELEENTRAFFYHRVPRSLIGTELEPFRETDLDFFALSYLTAEPATFGENVESMLIDNEDGTWLLRVDGEGFVAVFSCDSEGKNAVMQSYTILSPDLEGPRCVRLGDLFHEDFTRFRSGEGEMSEDGLTEVLYGTVGMAPYGLAEYGDGSEMSLRYVTNTLGGPEVELLLRYHDTVLEEIILHTLEEDK